MTPGRSRRYRNVFAFDTSRVFANWNGLDPDYTFVGIDNFRGLPGDKVALVFLG